MSWCWCGGSNPCNNMLLKYFWFDCSTWQSGKYVINVTRDTCGNCNAYFVPETVWSAFDCNNVVTCINTNTLVQSAIKNLLINLINSDASIQTAICWVNCWVSLPSNVTNLTSTDANGWVYDCWDPILNWSVSSWATSYDIFEWATLLWNTVSTTFTVVWASVWSHTYTVIAKNVSGSASWVTININVVACASWFTISWWWCTEAKSYTWSVFWCLANLTTWSEASIWLWTKTVTLTYNITSTVAWWYYQISLTRPSDFKERDNTTSSRVSAPWTTYTLAPWTDPAGTNYTWTVTWNNVDLSVWYWWLSVWWATWFPWQTWTFNSYTRTIS